MHGAAFTASYASTCTDMLVRKGDSGLGSRPLWDLPSLHCAWWLQHPVHPASLQVACFPMSVDGCTSHAVAVTICLMLLLCSTFMRSSCIAWSA